MLSDILSTNIDIEAFATILQNNDIIIAVLSPLLLGEIPIYLFGTLYGHGTVSIYIIIVSILSITLYDIIIYEWVKNSKRHKIVTSLYKTKLFHKINKIFLKHSKLYDKHPIFFLLILKAIPATKITIFLFALKYEEKLRTFAIKDTIATFIWGFLIFIPGYLVGIGTIESINTNTIQSYILTASIAILVLMLSGEFFEKAVMFLSKKFIANNKKNTLKEKNRTK